VRVRRPFDIDLTRHCAPIIACHTEDQGKKDEEKFEFTAEGEALGYISFDQARVLAMGTTRETPGDYGRRFRNVNMAFKVVEGTETADHYVVTPSFRPEGEFIGTPGREQFFIEKEVTVGTRQLPALPRLAGVRWFPVIPLAIGLVVVVTAVVIGVVFSDGGGSGGDEISAAVPIPTNTPPPTATAAPLAGSVLAGAPASTATLLPTETVAPPSTTAPRPIATLAPVMAAWVLPGISRHLAGTDASGP